MLGLVVLQRPTISVMSISGWVEFASAARSCLVRRRGGWSTNCDVIVVEPARTWAIGIEYDRVVDLTEGDVDVNEREEPVGDGSELVLLRPLVLVEDEKDENEVEVECGDL